MVLYLYRSKADSSSDSDGSHHTSNSESSKCNQRLVLLKPNYYPKVAEVFILVILCGFNHLIHIYVFTRADEVKGKLILIVTV